VRSLRQLIPVISDAWGKKLSLADQAAIAICRKERGMYKVQAFGQGKTAPRDGRIGTIKISGLIKKGLLGDRRSRNSRFHSSANITKG